MTEKWIPWPGGLMPVLPEVLVCAKFRDGEVVNGKAGLLSWKCIGAASDIVAYRLQGERAAVAAPRDRSDELPRAKLLDQAKQIICHDRQDTHGRPEDTFHLISEYWTVYLAHPISAADVALMMDLFKTARLQKNPGHTDSLLDKLGYTAIAGELLERAS